MVALLMSIKYLVKLDFFAISRRKSYLAAAVLTPAGERSVFTVGGIGGQGMGLEVGIVHRARVVP